MYHILKTTYSPMKDNSVEVRFWEGEWHHSEAQLLGQIPMVDFTTRQNIMTVLEDIQYIYIRASFDKDLIESSILSLDMDTAILANTSALVPAVFVEKCICPDGYAGDSCEVTNLSNELHQQPFKFFNYRISIKFYRNLI